MIAALVPRQTPPNAIEFTFDLDRCNQFLTLIACSLDHPPLRYSLIVVNYRFRLAISWKLSNFEMRKRREGENRRMEYSSYIVHEIQIRFIHLK